MTFPKFTAQASCANDTQPDDWFPQFEGMNNVHRSRWRDTFSHRPNNLRARTICLSCPAYDECLEYSLQYKDLDGIWANLDQYERAQEQRVRGLNPRMLPRAYVNELERLRPSEDTYLPIESEWQDEVW